MGSYRFDVRSKDDFKRDIKSSHRYEAEIALRLCIFEYNKTKQWPTLKSNGSDMSGEYIENDRDVSHAPDFRIGNRLVEITRSDVPCRRVFHIKDSKVRACLDNKFDFVFVDGFKTSKEPRFIWLTPQLVKQFSDRAEKAYGRVKHPGGGKVGIINKLALRYDLSWFDNIWQPLPVLITELPEQYSEILKIVK